MIEKEIPIDLNWKELFVRQTIAFVLPHVEARWQM